MKTLLLIAFLPLSVFAQVVSIDHYTVFWDAAYTDTIAAIRGTDTLYSQPFRCTTDMSMTVGVSAGDTSNNSFDSSKVQVWLQGSLDGSQFTNIVCGVDSIGLDSTFYDRSIKGTNAPDIVDISASCPIGWARFMAIGLPTNCKASGDSTKFTVDVDRFTN